MTHNITTDRPLVTFALFAYNQEKYIREAVEGAFSQTYQPLEIILSDDCSSDRTFEIMQEMAATYDGHHEVRVRRNVANLGVLSHVLSVARSAKGDILVVAAGDDISFPNRAEVVVQNFTGEDIYALSSDDIIIDDQGVVTDLDPERISQRDNWHNKAPTWLHGATAAYRTGFLKVLPFPENPIFYEDMVFADVIDALGKKSVRIRSPLIKYRYHLDNLSNRLFGDRSLQHLEEKVVERWQWASHAKNYTVLTVLLLAQRSIKIKAEVLSRLSGESKYLSLISSWQVNNLFERAKLLYFSFRYGNIKSSVIRVLGKKMFFTLKTYTRRNA